MDFTEDDHEQLIMLHKFPNLIPIDEDFTIYEGYFRAGELDWKLKVNAPHYPELRGVTLGYGWKLGQILEQCSSEIDDCRSKCSSLLEYLCAFQHLVEMRLRLPEIVARFSSERRPSTETYRNALAELNLLADHIEIFSKDLSKIKLKFIDFMERKHILDLELKPHSSDYSIRAELPAKAMLQEASGRTVSQYFVAFVELVGRLDDFFETMDDLDEHCWVIDPEQPDRTHTHRRIVIADAVSAVVTVDPFRPRLRPDIKIFGSVGGAAPFVAALNASLVDKPWCPPVNIVSNLLDVLDLPCFPTKPDTQPDAHLQLVQPGECHVCYEVRDEEGELAEVGCEGELCGRAYHRACLYQWLTTGGQGKTLYRRIHGPCPNCGKNISCPVPQQC